MLEVIFVRHGESEANRQNMIISYQGDPALTPEGLEQARRAAAAWGPAAAIYASPLKRTQQTAQAFCQPGQAVRVDPRLHEIALGRWDGLTIEDIEADDYDRYHQWKVNPELGAPDGGEPLSHVAERIHAFLDDVRKEHPDGRVVATTHSDCLKALLLSVLHAPWESAQWFHLTNTAGLAVQWKNGAWQLMAYPLMPV
ncbi:histidine phosphatase family protein [Sulfobacillus harzensis]|uniref:Histidine phosphatase family protein n=1 Tax=Sulfobacillus harzensis TaxID=2729629 RepID=A0A7Y0L3P7_9FIRM|nr:histidine phosphatase family protein [Sulfobacillus harzensis]